MCRASLGLFAGSGIDTSRPIELSFPPVDLGPALQGVRDAVASAAAVTTGSSGPASRRASSGGAQTSVPEQEDSSSVFDSSLVWSLPVPASPLKSALQSANIGSLSVRVYGVGLAALAGDAAGTRVVGKTNSAAVAGHLLAAAVVSPLDFSVSAGPEPDSTYDSSSASSAAAATISLSLGYSLSEVTRLRTVKATVLQIGIAHV